MRKKTRGKPAGGTGKTSGVGRVDVKLPRGLIDQIEKLVEQKMYLTKADFVRSAVRERLLAAERTANRAGEAK
jgi:Arc/MetJ-type ribon-helix-helix transcriptional regulator